jgi:AcrR family transcriptional regulator
MSNDRVRRVEQACLELVAAGEEVTFDAVAQRAGVGRATLYRHPELHALVHEHRQRATDAFTLTGLTIQIDQLRHSLEAVAAKVRHHEELLRKLTRPPPRTKSKKAK